MPSPNRRVTLLPQTTIAAAVNPMLTTTPISGLAGVTYAAIQAKFNYGSGGSGVSVYLQTSIDDGATWIDVAQIGFTTSAATKVSAVNANTALTASTAPTDGSLSANSIVNGLLGAQFRLKWGSSGTYAGATNLTVDLVLKGNPS